MNTLRSRWALVPLLALVIGAIGALGTGCGSKSNGEVSMKPPGLYGDPAQLPFTCVTPGCDSTVSVTIGVNGGRRLAVKRILIEGDTANDFTLTTSEMAPFVIGPGSNFSATLEYVPKGAPAPGAVGLHVTYTDASPDDSPDRAPAGELVVPLIRRVVGEPVLVVDPGSLSFGGVLPGGKKALSFKAINAGFGNVTLELDQPDSGTKDVIVVLPPDHSMGADSGVDVACTFAPTDSEYLSIDMPVKATSDTVVPAILHIEATSLTSPQLAVSPMPSIDFGEVAKGSMRTSVVQLVNQGGAELDVQSAVLNDPSGNLAVASPDGGWTLQSLDRGPLSITLNGLDAGEVSSVIHLKSNDPVNPNLDVQVKGTVTLPQAGVSPTMIDFGTVPQGWVVTKTVQINNTGFGSLTLKNLTFVAGSSNLFTLQNIPPLPIKLPTGGRASVDVQFRAETQASFTATLSVETDDPVNNFQSVSIKGVVGDCNAGCPITNGTPSCTNGTCAIGMCNAGWFDTDGLASTGCECNDDPDPGEFCMGAKDLGTLKDTDGNSASYQGLIPTKDDVDLIRFYGDDGNDIFFSDSYDVRIRLDSADPGIQMCVYRNDGHQADCYFSNEVCPQNRYFEKTGSWGSDDSADYIIKVTRTASSVPACTPYTIFASNG